MSRIDNNGSQDENDENGSGRRRRLRRNFDEESEEEMKEEEKEFVPTEGEYSLLKNAEADDGSSQACGLCKQEGTYLVGPFVQ